MNEGRMTNREYDRWKTDENYRTPEEVELDNTCAAYASLNPCKTVVTDFRSEPYKPGNKVRWLGPSNEQLEGRVIGAIQTEPWCHEPTYVVLMPDESIVQVGLICLLHEWESEFVRPIKKAPEKRDATFDEIPF